MAESLSEAFAIAARHLSADLVPRGERDRLLRQARQLAPIHCAGFECRLTGAPGRVDLQQRITPRDSEPARLAAFLLAAGLCAQPAWRRIREFMLAWSGGELARQVGECWLEIEPAGGPPSVFVSFHERGDRPDCMPALRRALALLVPPAQARRFSDAAEEISERLPNGARILDIGLMARRPAAMRVNIGGVRAADLAAVLAALGWDRREQARIDEFARAAAPYAQHPKLALDWYGKLLPRAGLEIVEGDDPELPVSPAAHARWRGLLAWLVARKACDARRAAALADWPGQDEPPDCPLPWPPSLVVESLVRGSNAFSVIGRRLSHVKIDFVPGRLPAAKAYFGFGRLWRGAPTGTQIHVRAPRLRDAMARATTALVTRRTSVGVWHDFREVSGGSDEWLSAYVAAALAHWGGNSGRRAARGAWTHLTACRPGPGWGYNAALAVDADSTLWVLRLADALGLLSAPQARSALALLRRHRGSDGGIASYLPEHLGAPRTARVPLAVAGWCQAHAEVTAAAGALPGFGASSAAWLLRSQKPDGRWETYWSDDDAFATALAVELLARRPGVAHRRAIARAACWSSARVGTDGSVSGVGLGAGSAFAAACCLRILLCAEQVNAIRSAVARLADWLLSAQCKEGGWLGSTAMRLPLPSDRQPVRLGPLNGFSWDENGTFTTATVLAACGRLAVSQARAAR